MKEPVTITIGQNNHFDLGVKFKFGEVVEVHNPVTGVTWNMVTNDSASKDGAVTINFRTLNVSKYKFIRRIELYIFKKLLNVSKHFN